MRTDAQIKFLYYPLCSNNIRKVIYLHEGFNVNDEKHKLM